MGEKSNYAKILRQWNEKDTERDVTMGCDNSLHTPCSGKGKELLALIKDTAKILEDIYGKNLPNDIEDELAMKALNIIHRAEAELYAEEEE